MSRAYKRAESECVHCGATGTADNPITAGHIIARHKGGSNSPDNYRPECRRCNSARH
ncbi:HNH endonuclease [Actinomadura sp. 9N215]|uniref:HNH endonuclease n=1 Tax=Actinomadura sp. 9N215 TaxID=3375150 RepID=UPI0037875757